MILCSRPECQTTAGCKCGSNLVSLPNAQIPVNLPWAMDPTGGIWDFLTQEQLDRIWKYATEVALKSRE